MEMMSVKNKITDLGLIPSDWQQRPLNSMSSFITKGATPTTYGFKWVETGVLFLRSECVSEHGLDLSQSMFISEEANKVLKRSEVQSYDILITITGYVGRVILLPKKFGIGNINQHIARIRINDEEVDKIYVYHYLSQPAYRRYFDSIVTGQAYPQLSLNQVREAYIFLPPTKKEQRAIATALSDTDALIAALDRLIAKKKAIKQGAMQELLTGRRRLEGFEGAWREWKVGDIGNTYSGLTGKTKEDFARGDGRYITFLNVMNNVRINITILESVDVKVGEHQNTAQYGDLFFNTSSETPEEVGMCAVLLDDVSQVYLNSFCFGFRLHESLELEPVYLAYYFRSSVGRNAFYSLAQGATRYNLSKTNFNNITLNLPQLDEQRAIAQILTDMDAEIAALERQRDKYKAVKAGMMQELLTGKTRLV